MFRYQASIERVVDGDTLIVNVNLGFYLRQTMKLRLARVNTPELRGEERPQGLAAKEFVETELASARVIAIETRKIGKYGRYVAELFYSKRKIKPQNVFRKKYSLNEKLLLNKLARPAD